MNTSKAPLELEWWRNHFNEMGQDAFLENRKRDYLATLEKFPSLDGESGIGLDMGNGLVSVFNFSDKNIVAVDPLNDEYKNIIHIEKGNIKYITDEGIPFKDEFFDYILCMNVIDHTPDPDKMTEELYRVLKPHGTLYFMVNFDDSLSHIHYKLWNGDMVKSLGKFVLQSATTDRVEKHKQTRYWGIYVK